MISSPSEFLIKFEYCTKRAHRSYQSLMSYNCQVVTISELMHTLENAGEIGVDIALHTVSDGSVTRTKPCCFVLDAPKEKTKDKRPVFPSENLFGDPKTWWPTELDCKVWWCL